MAIRGPDAASVLPMTLLFSLGFFCARFVLDRLLYKVRSQLLRRRLFPPRFALGSARSLAPRVLFVLLLNARWCCCRIRNRSM